MKKLIVATAIVLTFGFTATSCKSEQKETKETEKEIVKEVEEEVENKDLAVASYHCPMNCEEEKTYGEPGQCPVCKMDLKIKEDSENHDDHEEHEDEKE